MREPATTTLNSGAGNDTLDGGTGADDLDRRRRHRLDHLLRPARRASRSPSTAPRQRRLDRGRQRHPAATTSPPTSRTSPAATPTTRSTARPWPECAQGRRRQRLALRLSTATTRIDGGVGHGRPLSSGSRGSDFASYATATGPVNLTLDGIANDGGTADSNGTAAVTSCVDIENLTGGPCRRHDQRGLPATTSSTAATASTSSTAVPGADDILGGRLDRPRRLRQPHRRASRSRSRAEPTTATPRTTTARAATTSSMSSRPTGRPSTTRSSAPALERHPERRLRRRLAVGPRRRTTHSPAASEPTTYRAAPTAASALTPSPTRPRSARTTTTSPTSP